MREVRLRQEKQISQMSVRLNLKIMAGFLISGIYAPSDSDILSLFHII